MLLTEHDDTNRGAIVRIEPTGFDLAVPAGTSLMAAAAQSGIRWPSLCGGDAQCGVCAVEVLESGGPLADPGLAESQMLARLATRPRQNGNMRLACQWRPCAAARVLKVGVRAKAAGAAQTDAGQ